MLGSCIVHMPVHEHVIMCTEGCPRSYVSGDLIDKPEAYPLMTPTIVTAAVAGWPAVTH